MLSAPRCGSGGGSYNVGVPTKTENAEPDLLAEAVAGRIREIMAAADVSQTELATRLGVKSAYVWRVVEGRQNLSLRLLGRICLALEITLVELFRGVVVPPSIAGSRPYRTAAAKPPR